MGIKRAPQHVVQQEQGDTEMYTRSSDYNTQQSTELLHFAWSVSLNQTTHATSWRECLTNEIGVWTVTQDIGTEMGLKVLNLQTNRSRVVQTKFCFCVWTKTETGINWDRPELAVATMSCPGSVTVGRGRPTTQPCCSLDHRLTSTTTTASRPCTCRPSDVERSWRSWRPSTPWDRAVRRSSPGSPCSDALSPWRWRPTCAAGSPWTPCAVSWRRPWPAAGSSAVGCRPWDGVAEGRSAADCSVALRLDCACTLCTHKHAAPRACTPISSAPRHVQQSFSHGLGRFYCHESTFITIWASTAFRVFNSVDDCLFVNVITVKPFQMSSWWAKWDVEKGLSLTLSGDRW